MGHVRWPLIGFLICLAALSGVNRAFFVEERPVDLLIAVSCAVAAVWCCAIDGRVIGKPIPHIVQIMMLPVWLFAAPVYLFWTRKFWGLLVAFVILLGLGVVQVIAFVFTSMFF